MDTPTSKPMIGGCDCDYVRYEVKLKPLFVHCCHCSWCQRETGAAFALNAMVESSAVEVTENQPVLIATPSESGKGQNIARCPKCQIAVWSHYSGMGKLLSFIKVGTLDQPQLMPPEIHIFTQYKQDWFELPKDVPHFERYYDRNKVWPTESLKRFETLLEAT